MLIYLSVNDGCVAAIFALISGCVLAQRPSAMWSFGILVPSAALLPCDDVPERCRFIARAGNSPSFSGQAEPPDIHVPEIQNLVDSPSISGLAEPPDIDVPEILNLCWLEEFDE